MSIAIKTGKSHLGNVLSWIFGVSCAFAAIGAFFISVLAGIGYLFIALALLPPLNKIYREKFNFELSTKIKITIVIFGFILSGIGMVNYSETMENSGKDNKIPSSVYEPEKLNLKGMTPMQVLDKYFSYFNYVGINDRLIKISNEKQLASSVILELLETEESYLSKRKLLNSDLITTCFKQDICGNIIQSVNMWDKIKREFEVLSKQIIEETDDIVKIKVKHKTIFDNTFQVNETIGETTYILKKQDGNWKVSDLIDESGKLYSEIEELEKRRSEDDKAIQEERELYKKIKEMVDNTIKLNQFKSQLSTAINGVIPNERIISIDLGNYNNQTDKYVISITYYFKDVWLADNYLQVMSDASDIFKSVFPVNSKIYQVQTTVKEKYNDDYGNIQERYLARTSMNRATYTKINWEGFESSKLNDIANVAFYGDSIYKDLKDLEDQSKQWQNVPSGGFSMIEGAPASLCDDVKEQCNVYGECNTYEMLKLQGIC